MSGAGSIKWDGSDENTLVEVKTADKSHTLNRAYLASLFTQAARQGKDAMLIVEFPDLVVEARITRRSHA